MSDNLPITTRAKKTLEQELKRLLSVERAENIQAIEDARLQGDLSENADYDAAKERQAQLEARIQEIQGRLAGAEVIDTSKLSGDRVIFGAYVQVLDIDSDKESTYQVVGPEEADVKQGRISILSPLARAMVGKKEGDVVELHAPNKQNKEYEIVKIYFQ
jgi:transcription elongation factor GreA